VCNNNLRGVAGTLARQYGGTADEVRNDLVAGLAQGMTVVPAMVAAVHRAQLKGAPMSMPDWRSHPRLKVRDRRSMAGSNRSQNAECRTQNQKRESPILDTIVEWSDRRLNNSITG
jgi:hypothetical protein